MSLKYERVFPEKEPPFEVCPYQFTRCELPAGSTCPLKNKLVKVENPIEWRDLARKSESCKHRGDRLTIKQYMHHRLGVVI